MLSSRFRQRLLRTRAEDALPLLIEHQRIYILPTRRGWAFLFTLLLMLVASINYSLSLGYALSFLLTGLFAATLLHTYRNLAGLTVRTANATHVVAGERLPFTLSVQTDATTPRYGIRLMDRAKHDTRVDVPAGEHTEASLHQPTSRRGLQSLGRLTVESDWPLGLWFAWSYVHAPVQGLVFPKPEASPPPLPTGFSSGDEQDNAPPANTIKNATSRGDIAGLRDYREGDALSSVAWKHAARGQGLLVREFDSEQQHTDVTLTLASAVLSDTEAQLSRLAAWVQIAEASQTPYALRLPGVTIAAGHGPNHRLAAMTALASHGAPTDAQAA